MTTSAPRYRRARKLPTLTMRCAVIGGPAPSPPAVFFSRLSTGGNEGGLFVMRGRFARCRQPRKGTSEMDRYVTRNGQPVGPCDDATVIRMIESGELVGGSVCPVESQQWVDLASHAPFAEALRGASSAASTTSARSGTNSVVFTRRDVDRQHERRLPERQAHPEASVRFGVGDWVSGCAR
jgi:hypothetical protein